MEDNYGGEVISTKPGGKNFKRFTNAYMLVYVKESTIDEILAPVTKDDIPEHLSKYSQCFFLVPILNLIFLYRRAEV
jgi:ubiquitin carboxyl-terminal hydrolase 7